MRVMQLTLIAKQVKTLDAENKLAKKIKSGKSSFLAWIGNPV